MKQITKTILAAFAVTALIPMAAMAAGQDSKNQGYLVDAPGSVIVMNSTGLCWQSSEWTPSRSVDSCGRPITSVAAPAPVLAAALPVEAKPQAQSQKISFSGDALFAFDSAELKPEGKTMLDGLVRQIDGATYDSIVATGHTDRFGSNEYNQRLSERRAQSVKEYLISKNVQASRIDAEGTGESQPMTKAGNCQGEKSVKVVACLQPDRRVDVELTGAKTVVRTL
ncbi:OmpA family protein [Janthinobacterium sp. 17J80-10]|uniref:OmpA family protein n=1 Tax=Janthinobacterium sp. 17J80-10 TaxID=2497863 RepID=UPI00100559D5|nr:OmpA family protein [Janthinobacterium sp. 17J80-10]QAU35504.1 OmpA family protein [Janthinobacterium sp. 17J80-10]